MATKRKKSFNSETFLAECGEGRTIEKYRRHQAVFSQGDYADAVFYVIEGQVKVSIVSEQGKEVVIAIHKAKNFFGQRCLTGEPRRIGTVTTMTDSVIMRFEKDAIIRAIHNEPTFAEMFIICLLERSIRVEEDLIDQLFNSSEKRLARLLLILANSDEEEKSEQVTVKITQEILAEKIGTTRARVSFFMNKFRRLGFIDYKDGVQINSSLLNLFLHDQPQTQIDHYTEAAIPSIADSRFQQRADAQCTTHQNVSRARRQKKPISSG